jgi:hypothetical protein
MPGALTSAEYTFAVSQSTFGEESMFDPHRIFVQLSWMGRIAVVPVFAAVFVFAQSATGPCPHINGAVIPFNSTIQAKVPGLLDSDHLKVGKEIWVIVLNGLVYPGCTLNEGSIIYGHIKAITPGKDANSPKLSLTFDHADCEGSPRKEMPLWLIGVTAPPERLERLHEELPIEMKGGAPRNIRDVAKKQSFTDDILNPGGAPQTVRAGIVAGLPGLKLEVTGGPGCSAQITSTDHSVLLLRDSELILIAQSKK